MTLVGVGTAFVAACVADLKGDPKTRPFTRVSFLGYLLADAGVLSGLVSFTAATGRFFGGMA